MCVRECAVYGAGVLVGTRRRFWKEGRWEAGPGGKTAECGDENSSGCASLQRCEALLWVLPVTWKRVAPWAQQDSAEAWQCDRSCKVVVGGGSVVSGRGTFIPPPGVEP